MGKFSTGLIQFCVFRKKESPTEPLQIIIPFNRSILSQL